MHGAPVAAGQDRADDGLMTYDIAGEYEQTADPSQGTIKGVNGTILGAAARRQGRAWWVSRKAVCGHVDEPNELVDETGRPDMDASGLRCRGLYRHHGHCDLTPESLDHFDFRPD